MAETIEDTPAAATCPAAVSHSWPLTKDPSHNQGRMRFSCVSLSVTRNHKIQIQAQFAAGGPFEKDQRVFPKKVEKFGVPEFVVSTAVDSSTRHRA